MFPERVELEDGLNLLLLQAHPTEAEEVPVAQADGRVLAEDIISKENIPPFDRSPYDGYALIAADTVHASQDTPVSLKVIEEVPAGYAPVHRLNPGQAIKILTGAPVPSGATAIVRYKFYRKRSNHLFSLSGGKQYCPPRRRCERGGTGGGKGQTDITGAGGADGRTWI